MDKSDIFHDRGVSYETAEPIDLWLEIFHETVEMNSENPLYNSTEL